MCAIELPHLFVYRTASMGSVLLIHTVEIRKLKKLGIPVCREVMLRMGSIPCGNSEKIQKLMRTYDKRPCLILIRSYTVIEKWI